MCRVVESGPKYSRLSHDQIADQGFFHPQLAYSCNITLIALSTQAATLSWHPHLLSRSLGKLLHPKSLPYLGTTIIPCLIYLHLGHYPGKPGISTELLGIPNTTPGPPFGP